MKAISSRRGTDISRKLNSVKGISEKINYRFDEVLYYFAVAGYQNDRLNKALYYIEKCIELQKNDTDKKRSPRHIHFTGIFLIIQVIKRLHLKF